MKIWAIAAASVAAFIVIVPDGDAAEPAAPYVGLGVGIQFMGPLPFEGTGSFANSRSTLSFSDGPIVTGSVGYAFGNNFRTEFEFGYRDAPGNQLVLHSAAGSTAFTADLHVYTFLVNLLYDFDLARLSPGWANWSAHIGIGIGAANVTSNVSPSAVAFAYQPVAGIEYAVSPRLRFGVDYRFLGTDSANLTVTQANGTIGRTRGGSLDDHAVLFTMRWNFAD